MVRRFYRPWTSSSCPFPPPATAQIRPLSTKSSMVDRRSGMPTVWYRWISQSWQGIAVEVAGRCLTVVVLWPGTRKPSSLPSKPSSQRANTLLHRGGHASSAVRAALTAATTTKGSSHHEGSRDWIARKLLPQGGIPHLCRPPQTRMSRPRIATMKSRSWISFTVTPTRSAWLCG
jgi:hypothetical protein